MLKVYGPNSAKYIVIEMGINLSPCLTARDEFKYVLKCFIELRSVNEKGSWI